MLSQFCEKKKLDRSARSGPPLLGWAGPDQACVNGGCGEYPDTLCLMGEICLRLENFTFFGTSEQQRRVTGLFLKEVVCCCPSAGFITRCFGLPGLLVVTEVKSESS